MKTALIVIDPQKGFQTEYTEGYGRLLRAFIEKNNESYDVILFTQYKNFPESNFVKNLEWDGFMDESEFGFMEELSELVTQYPVFEKNTYGSFVTPEFGKYLQENKITDVHVVGIDTENCVLTFARDAFDRGYRVTVLKDLCRSHSAPHLHTAALEIIEENIGEVK